MRHRNGMSLIGMLVSLVIVLIVVAMMSRVLLGRRGSVTDESLPEGVDKPTTIMAPIRRAQNVQCITNLRTIGTGVLTYQVSNGERMPVMRAGPASDAGVNAPPTSDTITDAKYSADNWATLGDAGMQNVWLMVADQYVSPKGFHCPGDVEFVARPDDAKYGWSSPYQYSYSIQWPYAQTAASDRNPASFNTQLANVVTFADASPGGPVGPGRPASNHPGTNMLWVSGSVEYYSASDKSTVGYLDDDIYANTLGVAGGVPQGKHDTSLTLTGRQAE
jgi:hypothetical protein